MSDSLCHVIDSCAGNLTAANANDYVDSPEHTAVAAVRHLPGSNSRLTRLTEEESGVAGTGPEGSPGVATSGAS